MKSKEHFRKRQYVQWSCGAKEARDVQSSTRLQSKVEQKEESKEGSEKGWRIEEKLNFAGQDLVNFVKM